LEGIHINETKRGIKGGEENGKSSQFSKRETMMPIVNARENGEAVAGSRAVCPVLLR
jgi:hypothetical protein